MKNNSGEDAYIAIQKVDERINRILDETHGAYAAPAAPGALSISPYVNLWWDELRKQDPDLNKIAEYAPHVNVNQSNKDDFPLFLAAKKNNLSLLKKLIEVGANPNLQNNDIKTVLHILSIAGNADAVKILLKAGADPNIKDDSMTTALMYATYKGHDNVVKYLLEERADPNIQDNQLNTALIYASEKGYHTVVNDLLEAGADSNIKDILDNTAISYASKHGYFIIVKQLIAVGADINIHNIHGKTPLVMAYLEMHKEIVKHLLKAGANPNIVDNYKNTILIFATMKRDNEIIKELLSSGADPNLQNKDKNTALIIATAAEHVEIVKELLAAGADKTLKNKENKTAVDYAKKEEIIDLLYYPTPWTGFTRSDIAFTNEVFHQHLPPTTLSENFADKSLFSMCPICLRYIEHESRTCMYMTHSCVKEGGFERYYHKQLWNAFKYSKQSYDAQGNPTTTKEVVEWCTLCGRICKAHKHYKLEQLYDINKNIKIPQLIESGHYFATDCSKHGIGGGGLPEKVTRYRKFREVVLFLNDPRQIGNISFQKALNKLVEEVWEAPLAPKQLEIDYAIREKKYNNAVANVKFPLQHIEEEIQYNAPYPNHGNPDLLPVVYTKATTTMKNAAEAITGDTENIIQFRHRMVNGEINTHSEPYQQIALDNLMSYIHSVLENPYSEPDFGKCWQDAKAIKTMLPPQAKTISCTAKLYPEELFHAVNNATLTDEMKDKYLETCNSYRTAFHNKFGKPLTKMENSKSNGQNGGMRHKILRQTRKTYVFRKSI